MEGGAFDLILANYCPTRSAGGMCRGELIQLHAHMEGEVRTVCRIGGMPLPRRMVSMGLWDTIQPCQWCSC